MLTYEMVGLADENGRTYESTFGTYNKADGFVISKNALNTFFPAGENTEDSIADFFRAITHVNAWKLVKEPERKKMSIDDIEKELGYRIQITDPEYNKPENKKKELSDEDKKNIDDVIKFWKDWLGIELDPKRYY